MPDRRTLTVLASLVIGMTLTSGVLLVLEPGPVAPLSGVTLQSIDRSSLESPADRLFNTAEPRDWQGIVIHDSGAEVGSAETLRRWHRKLGRGGLGYHFVVNNGSKREDGLIELSDRWRNQQAGAYLTGEGSERFNRRYVGISLIGAGQREEFTRNQMQELAWLVRKLQQRYDIDPAHIHVDIRQGEGPAGTFPHAWFRKQLISPAADAATARR
jgi:hypothetical protein